MGDNCTVCERRLSLIRLRGVHQFAIAALVLAMPVASPAAVCLNGTDAYVQIGGDLPSYDSFTIELRALWDGSPPVPTDENSQASLFYEGSSGEVAVGYALLDGALFLRCSLKLEDDHWYGVPPVSLEPLCDGDVHHLAAVRDFG